MSHSSFLVVGAWSIFVSIQGTASAQSSSTTLRDSSDKALDPKTAVVAFYSALANEDFERASQFLLQPEKMKEWIKSQTELSASFKRWNKVVADKLGEEGSSIMMPNPIQLVADRSQDVDARVKGNIAEFPINNKNPLKLRRVANIWKLDIFSAYENPETLELLGVTKGEEALSLVTLKAREESKMLNAIAAEIEAERLTTPDQVRQRMRSEREAMNERALRAMRRAANKDGGEPD